MNLKEKNIFILNACLEKIYLTIKDFDLCDLHTSRKTICYSGRLAASSVDCLMNGKHLFRLQSMFC